MHIGTSKKSFIEILKHHQTAIDMHPFLGKVEFKPLIQLAEKVRKKYEFDVEAGVAIFRKNIKKIRNNLLDGKPLKDIDHEIAQNDYFNDLTKANNSNEAWDFFKKFKGIDDFDNTSATVEFYKEYANVIYGDETVPQLKIEKSEIPIYGIASVDDDPYLNFMIEPFRKMRKSFEETRGVSSFTVLMIKLLQYCGENKTYWDEKDAMEKNFGYMDIHHNRLQTLLRNFKELHKISDSNDAIEEFSKFMYENAGKNNFGSTLDNVYFPQNIMKNKEFNKTVSTPVSHTQHIIKQRQHKNEIDTSDFPKTVEGLDVVKEYLDGSNGARLVKDNKTKKLYVLKDGVGCKAQQIIEENIADSVYEFFGIPMAKSKIYKGCDRKVSKLSEYIDGKSLTDSGCRIHPTVIKHLQNGFAVDALLSNYDVMGLFNDNIKVDHNNIPYRIDNGGALRFTGTGKDKGYNFTNTNSDLWTLRKSNNIMCKRNNTVMNAHNVYEDMSYDDVMGQVVDILTKRDSLMEHLKNKGADSELLNKIGKRLDSMQEYHHMYTQMCVNDKYKPEYVDRLTEMDNVLTECGVFDSFPNVLSMPINNKAYNLIDSSGKPFGGIRGKGGATDRFFKELSNINDEFDSENGTRDSVCIGDMIKTYLHESAHSSWADVPVFFKKLFTDNLNTNISYINENKIQIQRVMQDVSTDFGLKGNNDKALLALQALHAFTYKLLRNTDMPFSNKENSTIRLMRTVTKTRLQSDLLNVNDIPKSGTYYDSGMLRGPLESYSQIEKIDVNGEELIVQDVPHHNAIYHYSMGAYYNDDKHEYDEESEIIAFHSHRPIKYNNDAVNVEFNLPLYDRDTPLNLV